MSKQELRLAGSGGQGVILATVVLAEAALLSGKYTAQSQAYGPEARGGSCKAETLISDSPIGFTKVQNPTFLMVLTGIGDLIVTCASMHSRNRRAGILIGEGKTMEEAMAEVKMVVEGVHSAKAAMQLAKKYDVELPIIEQVNEILFNNKPAKEAVKGLMLRDKKAEIGVEFDD